MFVGFNTGMKNLLLLTNILICTFLSSYYNVVKANEVVFQEDFNNDFSQWQIERGVFDWWQIVAGRGEATVETRGTITEISPKNWPTDLEYYEYSLDYTPISGADRNISFGFKDINNWYELHFVHNLGIKKMVDKEIVWAKILNFRMFNNRTYNIRIVLKEKHIIVYIDDQEIINETSDHFVNFGKISLKVGTGSVFPTKAKFDNITVKKHPTANQLPIERYKQTDPRWSGIEYDHASRWHPQQPTIDRWGCALTSMVMIMRYHGITKFLDESTIDPQSLNNWLIKEADGYVGGGLINWFALGRLTAQLSTKYATPKLEYSRIQGSEVTTAINELNQQRPVMLEIPGHFVVGSGSLGSSDLTIIDPFYEYQKLSQHNKELLSTRVFTPSQTDLSGILVASTDPIELSLHKLTHPTTPITAIDSYIQDPLEQVTSPVTKLIEIAKPETATYQVVVNSAQPFTKFDLTINTYQTDGSVSSANIKGVTNKDKKYQLKLEYDKNSKTFFQHQLSFESLLTDSLFLFSPPHDSPKYLELALKKYLLEALASNEKTQLKLVDFLEGIIETKKDLLNPLTYTYFQRSLEMLKTNIIAKKQV